MYILLEMRGNKNSPVVSGLVQQGPQLGCLRRPLALRLVAYIKIVI